MTQEQPKRRIEDFPTEELLQDKLASEADIALCRTALTIGVTTHRDGSSVRERLETNERIIAIIDAELARRRAEEEQCPTSPRS